MTETVTRETDVPNMAGSQSLLEQSGRFTNDLHDLWMRLYADQLKVVIAQRLEFVATSEQQWHAASASHYSQLCSQTDIAKEHFKRSDSTLSQHFDEFTKSTYKAFNAIGLAQPESITQTLGVEQIRPLPNDSKEEIRAKAAKRLKKRLSIAPKSKVPFRKMANFHLAHTGTNRLRGFLSKLLVSEISFREAWLETLLSPSIRSENESDLPFETLRQLVSDQDIYLQQYLKESASFMGDELQKGTLKIGISNLRSQQKLKMAELNQIKSALVAESKAFESRSNSQSVLLSLQLAQLMVGIHSELSMVKAMANEQLYLPAQQQLVVAERWLVQLGKLSKNTVEKLELVEQVVFDELWLNETIRRIQHLATMMPAQVEMTHKDEDLLTIDTAYLCDSIIEESIQLPLRAVLFELPGRYASALSSLADNMALVEFTITTKVETGNRADMLKNAMLKCDQQLIRAKEELAEIKEKFNTKLDRLYAHTQGRLQANSLVSEAKTLRKASLRKHRLSAFAGFTNRLSKPFRVLDEKYQKFLSNTHDDFIHSEFQNRNAGNESAHERLRNFMESIAPNAEALKELPFYYQQLFIGKHAPKENTFHHRHREMELASTALDRIESGVGGAIVILGGPLSGRSFFCDMLCMELEGRNIYKVDAPISGSTNQALLYKAIAHQLQLKEAGAKVLDKAPPESVFLFDDLELWWERHENGWGALLALKKMIATYGHKHVFLLSTTPYTYRLMRLKLAFEDVVLAAIPLLPFTQDATDNVMKQRHTTGGLVFTLDGKPEHLISTRKRLALADDLNELTGGNVGATFHLWLGLMTACDGEVMALRSPKHRELPLIQDTNQLIVLAQVLLHRHMGAKKLSRVLGCEFQEANEQLQKLHRSGMIMEVMGGSFRLVPYVIPFVVKRLKEFQLL